MKRRGFLDAIAVAALGVPLFGIKKKKSPGKTDDPYISTSSFDEDNCSLSFNMSDGTTVKVDLSDLADSSFAQMDDTPKTLFPHDILKI